MEEIIVGFSTILRDLFVYLKLTSLFLKTLSFYPLVVSSFPFGFLLLRRVSGPCWLFVF